MNWRGNIFLHCFSQPKNKCERFKQACLISFGPLRRSRGGYMRASSSCVRVCVAVRGRGGGRTD